MRMIRRSVLLAALRAPYPDDDGGGGGSPPAPPPPGGPLSGLAKEGDESDADLEKWKPTDAAHFDQRVLPKDMRDEDPHKAMGKLFTAFKGFRDQQARAEKAPDKPDGYTFDTPAELKEHFPDLGNDAAFKALQEGLHEAGLGQTAFSKATTKILAKLAETGVIAKPVTLEQEAAKLGGEVKAKERALSAKSFVDAAVANKVFDDGGKHPGRTERLSGALQSMWTHAEGVEFLEILQGGRMETGPGGGGGGSGGAMTLDQVKERMRDPKYDSTSPAFDRGFREETDRLNRQLHGAKTP